MQGTTGEGTHGRSSRYGGGDGPPAPTAPATGSAHPPTTGGAPGATSADFIVATFDAHNYRAVDAGFEGQAVGVETDGMTATATVRATTAAAQRYELGFVQTLESSHRRGLYHGASEQFVTHRGRMMDQLTEVGPPVPWYMPPAVIGSGPRPVSMHDSPRFMMPFTSRHGGRAEGMAGSDSFTTYLVAKLGSHIVYLGHIAWYVNWAGRFSPDHLHFSGAHAEVGGAAVGPGGNAVLGGPTPNALSEGELSDTSHFVSGGGAGATARRGGAHTGAHPRQRHGAVAQAFGAMPRRSRRPGRLGLQPASQRARVDGDGRGGVGAGRSR